jgi:NADH-ubiquinone oxidoreductase chain 6
MLNLFFLPSVFNGFSPEFLNILIVISLLSGVFIIISKNPIVSVLHLIVLFSSISCYLIFLGAKFIGLSYLLVYVGAVSILFLFILMLINIRVSELISDTNNNIPLAILTILGFFIPYNKILPDTKIAYNLDILNKDRSISIVSSNNWDSNLIDTYDIINIGNVMYTNLSMWLIITSIILLLAMVGSIVITVKQKY